LHETDFPWRCLTAAQKLLKTAGVKINEKNIAVFLDRDGTINEEVGYLDSLDKFKIIPCAYEAIRLINESGMKVVVISNQAGVAGDIYGRLCKNNP